MPALNKAYRRFEEVNPLMEYSTDSFLKLKVRPLSACTQYPYADYTIAALEDELLKSFLTSEKNQRFYYAQAEFFIRRINVYKPVPIFVLYLEDIPEALAWEIKSLGEVIMRVITNVVRRIYQSVDPEYFATSGIYSKIRWHLMEDMK